MFHSYVTNHQRVDGWETRFVAPWPAPFCSWEYVLGISGYQTLLLSLPPSHWIGKKTMWAVVDVLNKVAWWYSFFHNGFIKWFTWLLKLSIKDLWITTNDLKKGISRIDGLVSEAGVQCNRDLIWLSPNMLNNWTRTTPAAKWDNTKTQHGTMLLRSLGPNTRDNDQ